MSQADPFDFDSFLNHAKQLLHKDPRARTETQIKSLCKVVENIKFFSKYRDDSYDVIKSCCKFMTMETIAAGQPVFMIDSEGDKFYLILQGRVGIYIRKQHSEELPQETVRRVVKRHTKINVMDQDTLTRGVFKVAELTHGQSFGELALQSNGTRSATIVCLEDCTFGVLSKKDFNQILKNQERLNDIKAMGSFLHNPLVDTLKFPDRLFIFKNCEIKRFCKGDIVFKEGGVPTHIYIVRSGEFLLSKTFHSENDSNEDNPLANYSRRIKQKSLRTQMKIKTVGEEEIIGLDEIKLNMHNHELSCYSQFGDLMMIDKSLYLTRIQTNMKSRRYAESLGKLKGEQNELRVDFVSRNFENLTELLSQQRAKQSPASEQMHMYVRLKRRLQSPQTSQQNSVLKEVLLHCHSQSSLLINEPLLKLSRVSGVSPKGYNSTKSTQLQQFFIKMPRHQSRMISEQNISLDRDQAYHFRRPSNVFDRLLEKRCAELTLNSNKNFIVKRHQMPFLSTSTFLKKL